MYCRNCGKQLADDAKFCQSCGAMQGNGVNFRYTAKPHMNDKSNSLNDVFRCIGKVLILFGFIVPILMSFSIIFSGGYRYSNRETEFFAVLFILSFIFLVIGMSIWEAFRTK